jgi:hypothetical protein
MDQALKAHIKQVKHDSNPLMLQDPLDRQAGVYAKALRIVKNPKFEALDSETKNKVLSDYYKTYVEPSYKVSHLQPPEHDMWIRHMQNPDDRMSVHDFYLNRRGRIDATSDAKSAGLNLSASALHTMANIIHGAVSAGVKTDQKVFGLKPFFNAPSDASWKQKLVNVEAKMAAPTLKMSQDAIDTADFWFASRPTKSYSEKVGSFVGEQAVQLPFYEAIGGLRAIGLAASNADKILRAGQAAEGAGVFIKAANLTRRLGATTAGRFIGKRIAEASDAYIGDVVQQSKPEDRPRDVLIFMGLGAGIEGGSALLKPIGRMAMKKQLAHDAAIGGIPYVEAVTDQAHHELNEIVIGVGHDGTEIKMVHEGNGKYKISTPTQSWNVDGHDQALDASISAANISHEADPVKHSAVVAAKVSLISIAKEMYGDGAIWKNLTNSKQAAIRAEHAKRLSEAIEELPLHVPEVQQHEIKESIQRDIQLSPQLQQTYAQLNELGKDVGITVENGTARAENEGIKNETGVRSVQGASQKAKAQTETVKLKSPEELAAYRPEEKIRTREESYFGDLEHTGNLSYGAGTKRYDITFENRVDKVLFNLTGKGDKARSARPERMKRLMSYFNGTKTESEIEQMGQQVRAQIEAQVKDRRPKYGQNLGVESFKMPSMNKYQAPIKVAKEVSPRDYVSFKVDSLSYLKNGFSDRAKKAGQSLQKFLDGMDDTDFAQEVSDQMGNKIRFEKPYDLMLWAYHHKSDLPKEIGDRVFGYLHDEDPTITHEQLRHEAKVLDHHIEMLAYSGKLDTEGNVFRSTITSDYANRTKHQRKLMMDVSAQEIEDFRVVMGGFAQTNPNEYNAGLARLIKMQALRNKMKVLDAEREATADIRGYIKGAGNKKPGGFKNLDKHGFEIN